MSFSEATKTCFQKYVDFRGRASRPEFWWFVLLYYIVVFVASIPLISVTSINQPSFGQSDAATVGVVGSLIGLAFLALLLPYLAAGVRRLHDTGKSGWWWLISLVPFGSIILIVFFATAGDRGWNQYGPPPGQQPGPTPQATSLPPPPI